MKRWIFAVALACVAIFSFDCQKELSHIGSGGLKNGNAGSAPLTAVLQGNIIDENNQPAMGVTITVGSKTTTTDATGYFRIKEAPLDENASLVTAEKPGYFKAYRSFRATSGTNQVVIKLIKKLLAGTVDAGAGGEITLPNGSKITLPANAVVNAAGGTAYSGTVNVYAAYIDPQAPDISKTIPGSFMANNKDGKRVTLASYGMLAVELQSTGSERLQIASGHTATLTTPIPLSLQASAPATISLWYVDEQTGIWIEEGYAIKTGTNYIGQVKHFSFWNCDYSFPAISLAMTLKTTEGLPVVNTMVGIFTNTNGDSSYSGAYGWTDSLGQVSGLVPANQPLLLTVQNGCGSVIYSQHIGPFTTDDNLGTIAISSDIPYLNTIKGKLLNCNNTAVGNGYAIIYYDNTVRYAHTNSNGEFETTFTSCAGSPVSCDITGVDETAQQQGASVRVAIGNMSTDAGNITACGTSSTQFINYTLDGNDYVISSAASDSMIAYTYAQGPSQYTTYISGGHPINSWINFSFQGSGTGTFPLQSLSVNGTYSNYNTGLQVQITSYAQNPGEFYEGNFSGQFTDSVSAAVHNINCAFRLRKY